MKKRIFAILLAAMLTAPMLFSCAGETADETTADTGAGGENAAVDAETEAGWQYPDVDYQGGEYRILNFDQLWNMYIHMDAAEQTGEPLNDAVYNRNRTVEEALNCKIVEKNLECDSANTVTMLTDEAKTTIMAGEDEYDIMCLPVEKNLSLITEGYMMDLMAIDGLELQETWWDQFIIDAVTLDGKLYFVSGAANLMAFDSMWALFFNEDIMADHNLEKPYDLVREGKWTLDALMEYCSAVANLNGDDNFKWNKDGNAFYGISLHDSGAPEKFLFSADVHYAEAQGDDIVFTLSGDHTYAIFDKLASFLNQDMGLALKGHTTDFDADLGGYMHAFTAERTMFLSAEIKAAQLMRDMESTYGMVPFPKADEAQDNYRTTIVSTMLYWCIPTTNTHLDMTATVSEVLTHDSYVNVIPTYYDSVVEHKGLRNEDSIEMLEIMRQTKGVEIAAVFGWNASLSANIRTKLYAGDSQVASTIASAQPSFEADIAKFKEFLAD